MSKIGSLLRSYTRVFPNVWRESVKGNLVFPSAMRWSYCILVQGYVEDIHGAMTIDFRGFP